MLCFFSFFLFIYLFFSSYHLNRFSFSFLRYLCIKFPTSTRRLEYLNCNDFLTAACLYEISGNLKSLFSLLFCYLCLYFSDFRLLYYTKFKLSAVSNFQYSENMYDH